MGGFSQSEDGNKGFNGIEILYIAFEKKAIYEVSNNHDRIHLSPIRLFKIKVSDD